MPTFDWPRQSLILVKTKQQPTPPAPPPPLLQTFLTAKQVLYYHVNPEITFTFILTFFDEILVKVFVKFEVEAILKGDKLKFNVK